MKKSAFLGISILIVMFFITTQAHPIHPDRFFDTVMKRVGVCPKAGIGVCAELCGSGCPYGQLCCFNGCGHQCMNPVKAKSPGKCPNIQCLVSDCTVDKDCNNGMKCCSGCCAQPI